ncbi:S-adenosyl-L-methionine-dependent methyltransferase [Lophiostoma macrostomum CBS 122681]|uniref:S-adenosyl-L-methionine-dependent methyltransferase n=1 Tax=Lophiostoma macrostomum CBS 122681 TaxID=1314788 RepID=A0A6A6SM51_9PLEO|nr:S-adenosyl-L-methionine-dependent methyltransferase [Lophiostoma macrostomum CBS 122681]
MAFKPKQIPPYEASHLVELQGTISDSVIESTLALLPPFTPSDIIHDNACGNGQVTEMLLRHNPPNPNPPTIHATDINSTNISALAATAQQNAWSSVFPAVMPMQNLSFPDATFTHSFTSMAFHCCGSTVRAAREIHRTLQPGGIAVASIWTHMPHVRPFQEAHWRTRGREGPMPALLPVEEFGESELLRALEAGGFEKSRMWAGLGWSYLGALEGGWLERDEERWDEAVGEILGRLEGGCEGVSRDGEGGLVLKFVACVVVARK